MKNAYIVNLIKSEFFIAVTNYADYRMYYAYAILNTRDDFIDHYLTESAATLLLQKIIVIFIDIIKRD